MREELQKTLNHISETYHRKEQMKDNAFDSITLSDLRLIIQSLQTSISLCCDGCKYQCRSEEMSPDCRLCIRGSYGYDMYTPQN